MLIFRILLSAMPLHTVQVINSADMETQWEVFRPPMSQGVKNLPSVQQTQETQAPSLGQKDPLEGKMAIHSSILAWKIP